MFNFKQKVFASALMVGLTSALAYSENSLQSNIEFVRGVGKEAKLFKIYNKSNYELKNFKPSKGIVCNKSLLMPGEISECNATSTILGDFSTVSGTLYQLEALQSINIKNFSFEDGSLKGWEKEGRVFLSDDEIEGKKGNFYTVIEKSLEKPNKLTQVVAIENTKAYKLELLAVQENSINEIDKKGKVALLYLDKNKQPIKHFFAQKFITNTIEQGFRKYIVALPKAPEEAKYIQIAIVSGSSTVSVDDIHLSVVSDSIRYKRVFVVSKENKEIKNFGVEALCNTCDAKIGDFVWNDLDKDGYQDDNEPGIAGVKVYAIKDGKVVKTTTTDSSGYYHFCKLCKGNYKFKFELPKGWKFTKYTKGFDAHRSSAHADGYTDNLYVYATYRFCNVDAGAFKVPVAKPSIDIEKYTNGVDADTGTGPVVTVGSQVTWKYVVKNRGNVKLYEVYVNDDKEHLISCPKTTLNPGEVMTCYKKGIAKAGQYVNKGRVVGKDSEGTWVKDEDYSHYYGKLNWTCPSGFSKFTNPYNKKLYDGATTYLDVSNEFQNKLNKPSEIIIKNAYTWDGYNGRKNHTNQKNEQIRVVFIDENNHRYNTPYTQDLRDGVDYAEALTDLGTINLVHGAKKVIIAHVSNDEYGSRNHSSANSLYFEGFCYKIIDKSKPGIDIEKYTNGVDADTGTGPEVVVGSQITWKYVVKNTGNVALTDIVVKDNKEGTICSIASLAPGASKTCIKAGVAKAGQYANIATVTAKDPQGNSINDKDSSHYFGKNPNNATLGDYIWYDKNANGIQDPNEHGIEHVRVHLYKDGVDTGKVVYTDSNGKYEFTNLAPGKYQIKVDKPKNYPYFTLQNVGDDNKDSDINPSSGLSDPINLKSGQHCTNLDAGLVCGACSKIDIEKYTNGEDADSAKGPIVEVGSIVTWKYVVRNIGNTKLINIVVKDNKEGVITCPKTSLEPGEVMTCIKKGKAKEGQYENKVTVTAKPPVGTIVKDSDLSHYYGGKAAIDIEKYTNGVDADTGTGPEVVVGSQITWKYVVKNTGNVALTDIVVKDNKEGTICSIASLAPGASKTCIKAGVAKAGQYANIATVTAKDPQGNSINDKDSSHYYGKKGSCVGDFVWLDKNANGIQDSGEKGIAGVKVEITDENGNSVKDIQGNSVGAQITRSDGKYRFCKLNAGKYIIKITPPSGYVVSPKDQGGDDNKDSDVDPISGKTEIINLAEGVDDTRWDAGVYKPQSCLGDFVWEDKNANGIQDSNEKGIKGVKVELLDTNGNLAKDGYGNVVAPQTTNENGEYKFCHLNAGKYIVKITLPKGYILTQKDAGDDKKDSDFDPISKKTDVISLPANSNNFNIDAGLYKGACIGDLIWEDVNGNGIQDSGEEPISGVKVSLMDENGNSVTNIYGNDVAMQITKNDGKYQFCNLKPGKYKVKMVKDDPLYYVTYKDKGVDESKDSDIDPDNFTTDVITLESGEVNNDVDGGYFRCGSLVGVYSVIGMSAYGVDSINLSGLKVKVVDEYGNVVAESVTNKSGMVKFDNLLPGKYHLEYEKKEGLLFKVQGDVNKISSPSKIEKNLKAVEGVDVEVKSTSQIKKKSANTLNLFFALALFSIFGVIGFKRK